MTAGAMIVADGTTSQGELTRPLEKLGSVSVAQRMVDTFRHAGVDRIVLVSQQENRQALEKNIARTGAICLSPPNGGPVQMLSLIHISNASSTTRKRSYSASSLWAKAVRVSPLSLRFRW